MLTSARTTGSPPGSLNLSAQAPGPTSASRTGWAFHKPGMPGLSTEPGLPGFGSGDVGWTSRFSGEGLGSLGLLQALFPCSNHTLALVLYLDLFSVLSGE